MTAISFIFVDGIGIGNKSNDTNPLVQARTPFFDAVTANRGLVAPFDPIIQDWSAVVPTDACLSVPGLPQSATGQTALMTGINAPLLTGRHINGYPTRMLTSMIKASNIMMTSVQSGYSTYLVNAYSPEYFDMIQTRKRKHAAIALAAIAAEVPFCSLEDIGEQKSIYQDITNDLLRKWGHGIPQMESKKAGKIYGQILKNFNFSLFEYFQTDAAGHKQDMGRAVYIIETLDNFFSGIMENFDTDEDVLIISSDHGNIEDLSIGTHTRNPVPTIIIGKKALPYVHMVQNITDIAFLIRKLQYSN